MDVQPSEAGVRAERAERAVLAVGCAGLAVFAGVVLGLIPAGAWVRDVLLYNLGWLAAVIVIAIRAVRCGGTGQRLGWAAMALGLAAGVAANVNYSVVLAPMDSPPYPSWSDAGLLAMYPLSYVTVVALLRARIVRWHPSMWLDGLILALGLSALGAAVLLGPVLDVTGATVAVAITNAAYPLGDVLLISTVASGAWLLRHGLDRTWVLLTVGLTVMAVADSVYLLLDSAGAYREGTLLDLTWPASALLVAASAIAGPVTPPHTDLTEDQTHPVSALARWALLFVPMGVTVSSLFVLLPWAGGDASAAAQWLAAGALAAVVVRAALTFREVWELADARRLAQTDELTGLTNRRGFSALAITRLALACPEGDVGNPADLAGPAHPIDPADRAHPVEPIGSTALLLLDLDRFKEVNDSLGHHAGDELLVAIGRRLAEICRGPHDILARLGGDEFAVLLPDTDLAGAEQVACRIDAAMAEPFLLDDVRVQAAISVGIAVAPVHGSTLSLLMRRADIAMYRAKATRSGHAIYDPSQRDPDGEDRLQRVQELRLALDEGQITIHYQPKVDLATGLVTCAEALVRWQHPTQGTLTPDAFLGLAEDAGLMPALTTTVLDSALAQVSAWYHEGRDLAVAVNLPPATVVDTDLPDRVAASLARHQVPASRLKLEITEDSLLGDRVRAREVLARLRRLGVGIAIDDYGSGYSSLAYLRELPVDELKLDRSFVHPMASDSRAAAIVRSTVELAHSLGLRIVAEGVEHAATARALSSYGCDAAQGFHYARALPPEEFIRWLDDRTGLAPPAAVVPAPRRPGRDAFVEQDQRAR